MRLGLIGTGKQGQRYLLERNGGASIVSTYDRHTEGLVDWLTHERIDAVIVASHPASHPELVTHLLELRRPVLCEKPLALNLGDCERLFDLGLEKRTLLEVAHTHLWSEKWRAFPLGQRVATARARLVYTETDHDYSPWLDWAPHALALLEDVGANESLLSFELGAERKLEITWEGKAAPWKKETQTFFYDGDGSGKHTPMRNMLEAFKLAAKYGGAQRAHFNRRVYRALFAE